MHRLLLAPLLAGALPLCAQSSTAVGPQVDACTYDTCALRIEGNRVLRGAQGEVVGRFRFLRPPRLAALVGPSDSARHYAAEFDRHFGRGMRWSFVGGVVGGVSTIYVLDRRYSSVGSSDEWRGSDWAALAGVAVALGASVYSERQLSRARRGLSRALWWHNRDLAR